MVYQITLINTFVVEIVLVINRDFHPIKLVTTLKPQVNVTRPAADHERIYSPIIGLHHGYIGNSVFYVSQLEQFSQLTT